jgi:hypothetical protein
MTPKIDFTKQLDSYQARHRRFRILDVPPLQYLMIDGHGDPNTGREFADATATLYPIAYKLTFTSKKISARTTSTCRWRPVVVA